MRSPKTAFLTSNLLFEPLEGGSRQLLVWSSVGVGVCHRYIFEELEDGTLHRQLVQISVEEGDDALWEGRGAIEIHDGVLVGVVMTKSNSGEKFFPFYSWGLIKLGEQSSGMRK